MGAGLGMMMPAMIQQAMQSGGQTPAATGTTATGLAAAEIVPQGSAPGDIDFADLSPAATNPKTLVRTVVDSANWNLVETDDARRITIPVGPLRQQVVTVSSGGKDAGGHQIISYVSTCGQATGQNAMPRLRGRRTRPKSNSPTATSKLRAINRTGWINSISVK